MFEFIRNAWANVAGPFGKEETHRQVAALCFREEEGSKRVLLITSRDTGRWIVPKGWPIEGLDDPGAALQEAWEEAGVSKAEIEPAPFGDYHYDKWLSGGGHIPVCVSLFLTRVELLSDGYPEADQRDRAWFTPDEAADLVDEPELKALLRRL